MEILKKIKSRIKKKYIKITANLRRKKLKRDDFTIISNNCWGGFVYRYFGLPYLSPFVGLYVWTDDYMRLLENIEYYLSCPLVQIQLSESKYKNMIIEREQQNKILAKLDDVEMVLLHYPSWEEAKEKWDRRVARVNYENLVVKLSRQNLCTDEHIERFQKMKFDKKICFDNKPTSLPYSVYIPGFENAECLENDIDTFLNRVNLCDFLNDGKIVRS